MNRLIGILSMSFILSAAAAAAAEAPRPRASKEPARIERMVFGNDVVEAGRASGMGAMVQGERRSHSKRMRLRRLSFFPELMKSAENL